MGCQKWLCLCAPFFLTYLWLYRWCEPELPVSSWKMPKGRPISSMLWKVHKFWPILFLQNKTCPKAWATMMPCKSLSSNKNNRHWLWDTYMHKIFGTLCACYTNKWWKGLSMYWLLMERLIAIPSTMHSGTAFWILLYYSQVSPGPVLQPRCTWAGHEIKHNCPFHWIAQY